MSWQKIIIGDALKSLKKLPSESIDMAMTSPPYYGLRDYHIKGQIGLELTAEEYLQNLVTVFREIRRVLKSTGSLYLNMGDTYQKKNMMMLPARLALMLQKDGWILRNDIIWFKPNVMPASVKDRLQNKHEHIFHFVKSRDYYYDLDSIREPHKYGHEAKRDNRKGPLRHPTRKEHNAFKAGIMALRYPVCPPHRGHSWGNGYGRNTFPTKFHPKGKNPGDIFGLGNGNPGDFWRIPLKPCFLPHFAVYPEDICIKPIKSSCPPDGIVLDPFAGSATTMKVARNLGRNSIGIELSPKFVPAIKERMGWKSNKGRDWQIIRGANLKNGVFP